MPHRTTIFIAVLLGATLYCSCAFAQQPAIKSHADLDWSAARRWIHVDNVDSALAPLFEKARKGWLATLRKDGQLLGDGRPLFWHAKHGKVQTYFTFYPFSKWAEMDARRDMADQTDKTVGEQAVNEYDRGDTALVPPHYSEMWRRAESFDIVSPASDSLTELTANVGRLEFRQVDEMRWDEFNDLWKEMKTALVAANYPLTCRVYTNMFGNTGGQYILFWLASDTVTYDTAPTVSNALAKQLTSPKSAAIMSSLEKLFPATQSYEVQRRPDLCNLGK